MKITDLIPDFQNQLNSMVEEKGGVDVRIELKNKDFQVDAVFNV